MKQCCYNVFSKMSSFQPKIVRDTRKQESVINIQGKKQSIETIKSWNDCRNILNQQFKICSKDYKKSCLKDKGRYESNISPNRECQYRHKNYEMNQTEILLLKIAVNEIQQNEKCYREHQKQQKTL